MTLTYNAPFSPQMRHLQPDMKFGGVRAESTLEVSHELAEFLNRTARAAAGLLKGEWVDFEPGEYLGVALPTEAVPTRDQSFHMYRQVRFVVDQTQSFRLADYPRFFSARPSDPSIARGGPTWIPTALFPPQTFDRVHTIELFSGDQRIFGPAQRFFHRGDSGPIYAQLADGDGRLVLEITGRVGGLADGSLMMADSTIVLFTDPRFGEVADVQQVDASGERASLECELVGRDYIGTTHLFNEAVVRCVRTESSPVTLEIFFPQRGTGLAGGLGGGHITTRAFRPDATVR